MPVAVPDPAGPPLTATFAAPKEWLQVEIRWEDFPTTTPATITGLESVAAGPTGVELDELATR